ncbi:MAG: preprotein translocase subunit SecY, partial [Candidatus Nanohaloarchaeota archaeon QJJ-5]|nr:preprotein translocase subunit SecY [Candidatus Nanohaloarchaeota archaeon QJJ-5]
MSVILQLARYLPSIRKPDRSLSFREKIMWTLVTLLLYFLMSEVYIFGADPQQITQFQTFQTILGSSIGTLITLGIGPIVSASIILQLLTGADIIPWNLNSQEGKAKFQDTQKLLSYAFALFQSIAFVAMGAISPAISGPAGIAIVAAQLTIGGWFIIMMDEVISKW